MKSLIEATDSELALLGAAMLEPKAVAPIFERLTADHFHDPVYARIWDWMRRRGENFDLALVCQEFQTDDGLNELGGAEFLWEVMDRAMLHSIDAHADAVMDAAVRRGVVQLAEGAISLAKARRGEGEAILAELERGAADIARSGLQRVQAMPVGITALEMLETAYNGGYKGSSVGIDTLDHVTGGIRQDDVWFLGGRTSMGKSVAGLCLARGIAEQGRGVLAFSLEMPMREVQARLIADIAYDRRVVENGADGGNVRYGDILKGRGTAWQRDRAKRAASLLASLPVLVNDKGGLTIEEIRSEALRQVRSWEKAGIAPGAILIDHIGLVKAHTKRGDSKAAETADIVNELKGIAKQIKCPIIALVQVNRNTESRQDKRPTLADLNWSGAIEQIADFICLLYREAYYLERSTTEGDDVKAVYAKYDLDLLIQKNRSGPICNLKAFVDVACNAVRDREPSREALHA